MNVFVQPEYLIWKNELTIHHKSLQITHSFYYFQLQTIIMRSIALSFIGILMGLITIAQYKYDNVQFKTVYPEDICKQLKEQPGYLLLDVRSSGEYADTSSSGLNIGRFATAKNINVRELSTRIKELEDYKHKPVFIYCSHSQRSRRASKMLADSGFTNVININGGMTAVRQLSFSGNTCLKDQLVFNNGYNLLSASDLCDKLTHDARHIFLLDVRSDSAFRHISNDAKVNAYGYFRNSLHIPLADLEANLAKVPADREIIIIDLFGDDAVSAAALLIRNQYKKISVLLEGVDRLLYTASYTQGCIKEYYISPVKFQVISAIGLPALLKAFPDHLFVDIRTAEEFNNHFKDYWRNIGQLHGAVNIPIADLNRDWKLIEKYRDKPVICYGFGSATIAYEAAAMLEKNAFRSVYVLQGGIFNIGWTAANVKGFRSLASLRDNVPLENQ